MAELPSSKPVGEERNASPRAARRMEESIENNDGGARCAPADLSAMGGILAMGKVDCKVKKISWMIYKIASKHRARFAKGQMPTRSVH
jgi:hypothetical protein